MAAVLVTAPLVSCGAGSSSGGDDSTVKIGFVGSLSGSGGVFAQQSIQSLKLALAEIAEAKVVARKFEVVYADDASDPRTSHTVCQRLVFQDKVDVVLGFQNSANRAGCLPVTQQGRNIPYLYATAYEGGQCGSGFFVDDGVPRQQVGPLIDYMVKDRAAKKWFLVGNDYAADRIAHKHAIERIGQLGGQALGEEYAPIGTTDWTPIIAKVMASGADTLMIDAVGSDLIAFMKQFRATSGNARLQLASFTPPIGAGKVAKGIHLSASYFPALTNPRNQAYLAGLKKMFGAKAQTPSLLSVPTYDFTWLYAKALAKAGSAKPTAVSKAMLQVSFDGPRGKIQLNSEGHVTIPMYVALLAGDPLEGGEQIVKRFDSVEPGPQCAE
ncbi:ABC transporter substrate-binding protein [Actinomadura sp. B10D3]|uniref:ABC transporter substrate-binding protein n=1 Tax=Actinomadura sp. B10D3 TaxID=3153557 RepID=UPI00325F04AF